MSLDRRRYTVFRLSQRHQRVVPSHVDQWVGTHPAVEYSFQFGLRERRHLGVARDRFEGEPCLRQGFTESVLEEDPLSVPSPRFEQIGEVWTQVELVEYASDVVACGNGPRKRVGLAPALDEHHSPPPSRKQ